MTSNIFSPLFTIQRFTMITDLPYDIYYNITQFAVKNPATIDSLYELEKEYKYFQELLTLNKEFHTYYTMRHPYLKAYKIRKQILQTKKNYYTLIQQFEDTIHDNILYDRKPGISYTRFQCQLCRDMITPTREPTLDDELRENECICVRCAENTPQCWTCGIYITGRILRMSDTTRGHVCSYDCHYAHKYCLDVYDINDEEDTDERYNFKWRVSRGCYNASYKQYYIENPL